MAKEQEVVLITGCSRGGIGYALAQAFAQKNCIVFATGRKLDSMEGLHEQHPNIHTLQLDVLSEDSRNNAVDAVIQQFGRIDILVNNAGVHCVGPVAELPATVLENTFKTNVYAPISMIQSVVPHMIAQRKGRIVNVGSIVAFGAGPWAGGYCGSKAALHALSDSLRMELKPFGIHVIIVAPGSVRSNIGVNSSAIYNDVPKWRYYQPWEEFIKARTTYSQRPSCTPTEEFAMKTVDAVLKKNPAACFAYGDLSLLASILYYVPLRIRDYILMRIFGLLKKVEHLKGD